MNKETFHILFIIFFKKLAIKNLLLRTMLVVFTLVDILAQSYEWNTISEVPSGMNKIYFVDPINGWVVGDSGKIYSTVNGGTTWLPQISGTINKLVSLYFIDNQIGFASGYNRTLLQTNNKGNRWSTVQVVSDSGTIYSSLSTDIDNNLYFISNFGEVYSSNDSGVSWQNIYNFNEYGFSYIDYSNKPVCFAKLYGIGVLFKSIDGGNTWKKLTAILSPAFCGDFYSLNGSIGWITESWLQSSSFHDSASIYFSSDSGETWTPQSTLEGRAINNLVFADTLEGWCSSYGVVPAKIYFTSDGGKSWTSQFECDSTDYIEDIFFLNNSYGWTLTNQGKIIKYGEPIQVSADKPGNIYAEEFIIYQNYPNPFNPTTSISFRLPTRSFVTLKVFDILGKEIETMISEEMPAGSYSREWNAVNLPSGVYFYRLQAGSFTQMKKLILLK